MRTGVSDLNDTVPLSDTLGLGEEGWWVLVCPVRGMRGVLPVYLPGVKGVISMKRVSSFVAIDDSQLNLDFNQNVSIKLFESIQRRQSDSVIDSNYPAKAG